MGVIEAVLAVVGLLTLVILAVGWHLDRSSDRPSEDDRADQYRAGLDAAIRIQTAAYYCEQQLHAEAMRRAEADGLATKSEGAPQE